MGVDRTDYLMLGVDVGASAFNWDRHEDERNGAPNRRFDIVYDGMSGAYCIAGKIIAVSKPYEGIAMTKINPDDLGVDRSELASVLTKEFGGPVHPEDLSLMLFSHFS
jgi:hypothetical protein